MSDESMDWEEATPSQRALDQQLQAQAAIRAAEHQGRINLARGHVQETVSEGGDPATGRELLGRLDTLAENPEYEDADQVYSEYRKYIRGVGQRAQAPAASTPPARPAPPARADKNKARRDYADGKITTAEARKLGIV